MCLSSVSLNLEYNAKEGCFIGYGYKKLAGNVVDKKRRVNNSLITRRNVGNVAKLENGWLESVGAKSYDSETPDNESIILSEDNKLYYPGFHIFLKEEDAKNYPYTNGDVVLVKFSEVTSFGRNQTGSYQYGNCVVAKYMKIMGLAEDFE